ncbi:MAG: PAS domain S-box protein, partial [Candidatus Hodarchaeota archaeon]
MHLVEDIITTSLKKDQFQILIDSFDYPIYVINRDFRIVMVNLALTKITREILNRSDFIGKPIDTLSYVSSSIINDFKQVFNTGETFTSLERIKTDNDTLFIETRKIPVFDGENVERIMTVVIDVVNNDEGGYKSLVNNIPVGVYRISSSYQGSFLKVNPELVNILGFDSVEDLLKCFIPEFIVNQEIMSCAFNPSHDYNRNRIQDFELELRRKDGSQFWAALSAQLKFNAKGNLEWIDGIVEDITEKKKLREKLQDTERRYEALFQSSNDAILIIDLDGAILDFNQVACKILQYTPEELKTKTTNDLISPMEQEDSKKKIEQILIHNKLSLYHRIFLTKDGTERLAEINLSVVRDSEGRPIYLQVIARDVTKRKQEEQARFELDSRRKKFTEFATHEFRTPLTVIKGFIEL